LTGQRVHNVMEHILAVAESRSTRVTTSAVNEALADLTTRLPPPHHRGAPVRFLYATQATVDPPTFVIFANYPEAVNESYLRYLRRGFRERWGFTGTPIRIRMRARAEKKKR
jgi:GTP-binding protein